MVYFVTHSIMYVPRNREICRNNSIGLRLIWFVKAHGELDAFGQRIGPRCLGLSPYTIEADMGVVAKNVGEQ